MKQLGIFCTSVLGLSLLAACPSNDVSPVVSTEAGTGANTDAGTSNAVTDTNQSMSGVSDGATSTTGGDATTTIAGSGTGNSFIDPETSSGGGGPQANGAMCVGPEDCESTFCYSIPLAGAACSECESDADCPAGTCSIDANLLYAVCTDGGVGVMCENSEGCMGELVCAQVLDLGGLFPGDFCSECETTAECDGDTICSPSYDAENFTGFLGCVAPGSVPNNSGCPEVDGVGDGSVCTSGHCGAADVMGILQLGICGECSGDVDCDPGMSCIPATLGGNTLQGAVCQ